MRIVPHVPLDRIMVKWNRMTVPSDHVNPLSISE